MEPARTQRTRRVAGRELHDVGRGTAVWALGDYRLAQPEGSRGWDVYRADCGLLPWTLEPPYEPAVIDAFSKLAGAVRFLTDGGWA